MRHRPGPVHRDTPAQAGAHAGERGAVGQTVTRWVAWSRPAPFGAWPATLATGVVAPPPTCFVWS